MANERPNFGMMFEPYSEQPKDLTKPKKLEPKELEELGRLMGGRKVETGKDDNPYIPTGFVPLGQFMAHDILFDPTPVSDRPIQLSAITNLRTPAFDLDSLYGDGPNNMTSQLYDTEKRGRFLLDEGKEFDLPRNSQGKAIIGDPRNDSNLLLAQLHLAFLKFHNAVWDQANSVADSIRDDRGRFEKTRRLVRWHYQWMILREFLPCLVGQDTVLDVLTKSRKWYRKDGPCPPPSIPVEFSAAAFRFGHSQTHAVYRINDNSEIGRLPLFSARPPSNKRYDLRGGSITKDYAVKWKYFFNTGVEVKPLASRDSKKIGTKLPGPLLHHTPGQPGESPSLAVRDLQRGQQRGLLAGQEVARRMDFVPVPDQELWKDLPQEFQGKLAPLWYYVLKEAEVQKGGKMLGEVGGHLVAEVIIGLLQEDPESFLCKGKGDLDHLIALLKKEDTKKSDDLRWRPVLPIKDDRTNTKGDFTIVDLLRFAKTDTE